MTSRFALTIWIVLRSSISTPDGALILDDHAPREAVDQTHILALQRGAQIGVGGGPAATVEDRLFHRSKAFLLGAVVVVGRLEPGLTACLDEGGVERVLARAALHAQRPVRAAPAILAAAWRVSMRVK